MVGLNLTNIASKSFEYFIFFKFLYLNICALKLIGEVNFLVISQFSMTKFTFWEKFEYLSTNIEQVFA